MKIIQLILIPALLVIVFFYFVRFRSRLIDRIIILALGFCGMGMVIFPNLADKAARAFGVGRGVDLVMYLALTGLSFVCLVLFSKVRELHEQMTALARAQAIAHASQGQHKLGKLP